MIEPGLWTLLLPAAVLAVGIGWLAGRRGVAQLAQHLGLPLRDIKIVMVNGRQHQVDDPMRDGDRIAYFPAVGGG